ncbi:TonB-dependent receptor [Ruixingdingia sedimenti]|uniref:TonB-dependent siderophore receptor n=1 Tax=Ruixingdingia sedimenti TaxID=3073604 RepID=A0ABU1F4S6_9RHOB|nr:TonB-dependent siderophore receptor [Xinfangfangia sp. LG-4]MDR5651873.1 TonB-dependent siderophore receptor [Xinfangfangia sp. LG-4]
MTTSRPPQTGAAETPAQIRTTLGLLPVLAISAAVAAPAHAQTAQQPETTVLDPITLQARPDPATNLTVTEGSSSKLTAPLLDTPKTISIITQREIEERGATSVLEVLRTTPGVTLGSGEGGTPLGDRMFVRGFQAATDMMVDGVRNLGRTSQEAFAVESVEIAKGPGGAYSGRGSTGGSINLVSKQAHEGETFHHLSATAGNASHARLTYDGNYDLGNGLAARLNLMAQDSGVPGRDYLKDDRRGIAIALSKRFGEGSKLSFNVLHTKADTTPDLGVPFANANYVATHGTDFGTGTLADPFRPLESMRAENFYGSVLRDHREVTNQSAQLKFEHEFSDNLRLESALTWIGSEQFYQVTRPTINAAGEVARDLRSGGKKNRGVAFTTALTGTFHTGTIQHDFAVGIELTRDKLSSASLTGGYTVPPTDLFNPDPLTPVTGAPVWGPFGLPTTTDTRALYVFDTMTFNPQWELNLGLRFDRYEVNTYGTVGGVPDTPFGRTDNMVNYSLGLVYKPAPNGSIYLSFGTSSNPSGECATMAGGADGAAACTLTANNANLEPEKNRSIEIGTKWAVFDERLLLTAAVFHTEKTNQRALDPLGNVALIGNSRAQGFELGAAGQINDRWGISAGYAFTDAKLVDGGFVGGVADPDNGNQLQFVARHSFSLWTTYDVTDRLTLGGGATFTGKRFLNAANTAILPSQWRVDAFAAYEINEKADLQLNVTNLFDERLYDASHVGLFANRAPGRAATLKVNYRF